jgi:hypothetical protein|tara:strand:- start:725 stop:1729 length:1005 start_codon:yes stop_codon:yes gene_type:complete
MAALGVTNPTLLDLAKATDPDGGIADIVEILAEQNEILDDMTWVEGNLTTGNRTSIRTGLPTPTWRKMYGGVQPDKGTQAQVDDATGMLEAYAEVDKALADLSNNTAAFRMVEERAHLEGLNQEIVDTLFYGNETTEPEAFTGFSPRYNSLSADNSDNVIAGGGSGTDNASIWLMVWSPQTCFGIIPKGSVAGLQRSDLGEVTLEDASGGSNTGRMQAYRTHYRWDAGLTVRDWRYVVRICNIDKSALTNDASSGADLPDLMFQALTQIPNLNMGRSAFYMSRNTMSFVRRQATNATSGSTLTIDNVGGKMITQFQGIPLRRCDALAADEALIS